MFLRALLTVLCFGPLLLAQEQGSSPRRAPYPASTRITSIDWAPADSILRQARGGDNWPVTWGPDDAIYSTWGDGRGFEPFVERKLSCGFVRVTGEPERFRGENIRSPAEQLGAGRNGKKGWGILSVAGRLYLWFGHADQQGAAMQLAWSDDLAKTWTWADWRFDDLGMIGFVNFGRDYQGARDEYVYAYSHDGPRADTPADRFVLLRAPKGKLTERSAWEFFAKLDESGEPVWTRDFARRGSVFDHKDACLRSAMTWCAGLERYLWWQQIPQPVGHKDRGDTRFDGGFGIYDAPEPWGPWTTAYFTDKWDVGPGEHADFPARWMSPDGHTLHLVFSGEDSFSVRQATVLVKATPRLRFGGFSGATGGYSGIRGTSDGLAQLRVALLNDEKVKRELGLTGEQAVAAEGLRERAASLMPSGTSLSHLSPEEQRKAVEEIQARLASTAKEIHGRVSAILRPEQLARLDQISLQLQGLEALADPDLRKRLAVSDEQMVQFVAIAQEARVRVSRLRSQTRQASRVFVAPELRREFTDKVLAVLTREQREQFEALQGRGMELEVPRGLPGRPRIR